MATKPQRTHLKRYDWREPNSSTPAAIIKTYQRSMQKRNKKTFISRGEGSCCEY